jgi:hypothetical protein
MKTVLAAHVLSLARTAVLQAHMAVEPLLCRILHRPGCGKFIKVGVIVGDVIVGGWVNAASVGTFAPLWTLSRILWCHLALIGMQDTIFA